MKKQSKKLLVMTLSLAMLICTPVFANGVEDQDTVSNNNKAIGAASANVHGSKNKADSIGAAINGGSENVAIGVSKITIHGNKNEVGAIGALVEGGTGNTSIGTADMTVKGDNQSAVGFGAKTGHGDYNTAVGSYTVAGGSKEAPSSYNTAYGSYAEATGGESTAIGAGAKATGYSSVAIGAGSVATEAGTVSVGNSEYQRRIVNVAPGIYDTDAVNMSQLRTLGDKVDRVGASAAAFSALAPLPYDPKEPTQYSAGIGTYNGTGAVALGVYHYTNPDVMLNAAISISNDGWEKHARVGISWRTGGSKAKEITPAVEPKESIVDRVQRILDENKAE